MAALTAFIAMAIPVARSASVQISHPGSIHGSVVAVLSAPQPAIALGAVTRIFVPNIQVTARSLRGGTTSAPVATNAEGYFRTPELAPGIYQICVTGTGYTARCDDARIEVNRPTALASHIIEIRPSGRAMHGTVWLADRSTPCFWFSPMMSSLPMTAQVSLLSPTGQALAGPASGNASGQYVLPLGDVPDTALLHAECAAAAGDLAVRLNTLFAPQDVAVANHKPSIVSFDLTSDGAGVRRADAGATVQATVQATDLDNDTLHYAWSDDSGRSLNLPDAPSVAWPLLDVNGLNTLHVQVSDGRGGFASAGRTLQSGVNALMFTGHVFNRQSHAGIAGASVALNTTVVQTDAGGNFLVSVPDARNFVLSVSKPGYAPSSQVLNTLAINIQVPLDAAQLATINGKTGGTIGIAPGAGGDHGGTCDCRCEPRWHGGDHDEPRTIVETEDTRVTVERRRREGAGGCGKVDPDGAGNLGVTFPPGAFVTATGAPYDGEVTVEGLQYDLTASNATPGTNPIPGDYGAVYQGKTVRLATFGAFHLLPRDTAGNALAMAPGKSAQISLPIQNVQLAAAPAVIPFFHLDEASGQWVEDGKLTRNGNRYAGAVKHFSLFNADTQFPGGACVKVILDSSFTLPVTLDATYYDSAAGSFHHNGTTSADPVIGVERMTPNQNFTLTITDSESPPAVVSVSLYSGPGLNPTLFPSGYDTDTMNFSHCNGPIQVTNNVVPPVVPYFLGPVFGPPSITDNSAAYQKATEAATGQPRNTLNGWKTLNGFNINGTVKSGEAQAIYFNNGDLKFGRDMHCRLTNSSGAIACYVANFGNVGTDDSTTAVPLAEKYEADGQGITNPAAPLPTATVAMEYDPVKGVQFFAYKDAVIKGVADGTYLAKPALDDQGPKPMPDICMACHQGSYSGGSNVNNGANFLPFDLGSYLNALGQTFPSAPPTAAVQEQFRQLNNLVAKSAPPPAVTEVINLWYHSKVGTANQPFDFTQGAAQLPAAPFAGHEPLYDNVVAPVCRTCHTSVGGPLAWDTFAQMNTAAGDIQSVVCGPNYQYMPHAEVPWKRFWQQSLSSTVASQLFESNSSTPGGCPNH